MKNILLMKNKLLSDLIKNIIMTDRMENTLLTDRKKDGWMDELGFYVLSTVFQSFGDDGRVNMKGSVQ